MWCGAQKKFLAGRWRTTAQIEEVTCLRCLRALRRHHERMAEWASALEEGERARRHPQDSGPT